VTASALSIDIISDLVCPWCFIGKRRLEAALALYRAQHPERPEPVVRWWPYQLNPDLPAEGIDRSDYLEQKFGPASVAQIYARVAAVGREAGIPFAFDRMVRQPNTLAAHCLVALAGLYGVQDAMQEALFRAYFIAGADLTREETLVAIALDAGLQETAVRECLAGTEAREQTAREDARARELGVEGVPFFIFNHKVSVSGAQPEEVLLEAMRQSEAALVVAMSAVH
jgi:predicted DsbA family dithiol-disulfide isomerase